MVQRPPGYEKKDEVCGVHSYFTCQVVRRSARSDDLKIPGHCSAARA